MRKCILDDDRDYSSETEAYPDFRHPSFVHFWDFYFISIRDRTAFDRRVAYKGGGDGFPGYQLRPGPDGNLPGRREEISTGPFTFSTPGLSKRPRSVRGSRPGKSRRQDAVLYRI